MKTLIVYDSYFGNTEKIANAISDRLALAGEVDMVGVRDASPQMIQARDLIVVGSPTRAFSPTGAVKKFIKGIPAQGLKDVPVAAFDTRMMEEDITAPILKFLVDRFGYAAETIQGKLEAKGGRPLAPAEPFYVTGEEGPLKEGEEKRAQEWGEQLGKLCSPTESSR